MSNTPDLMAFQKIIALPTGVSGSYSRITNFYWDRNAREASAHFALYLNQATSVTGQPLVPLIAKLRLYGARFDEYLGATALAASDHDVIAQLYLAARAACITYEQTGERDPLAMVICDYGSDVFADAISV